VDDFIANLSVMDELYDVYTRSRSSVDLQARVRLNDSFTLVGEISNLTNEDMLSYRQFPFGDLLAEETQRGRTVWLGIKWAPFR
jgi:outer membrane receptor protein involved in Fe transport